MTAKSVLARPLRPAPRGACPYLPPCYTTGFDSRGRGDISPPEFSYIILIK